MSDTLGSLLKNMIKKLNSCRSEKMQYTMEYLGGVLSVSPDTIYTWRQDKHKPDFDALTKLVEIGVNKAEMNRNWAEKILDKSKHPDHIYIIDQLFLETV